MGSTLMLKEDMFKKADDDSKRPLGNRFICGVNTGSEYSPSTGRYSIVFDPLAYKRHAKGSVPVSGVRCAITSNGGQVEQLEETPKQRKR